ncbi:MAG: hypothetical protein IJP97_08905 [Synergistaceae bacterium]|nr:hypothetical protein [Synergistaceae bacterium]
MKIERKRIFILVKTYPRVSKHYRETVCTAGIMENGSWVRLYPVPFRILKDENKYKKYTRINVNAARHSSDFRIESYCPDTESITAEPEMPKIKGRADWETRKHIILDNQKVYTNLRELITDAKTIKKSLAVFKPKEIISFDERECSSEWDSETLAYIEAQERQLNLPGITDDSIQYLRLAKKIPYEFRYTFTDDEGKKASLMIEDWETGMLYLNCRKGKGNDQAAIDDVRKKYIDDFARTKDVYFFLGTTKKWHNVSPNPFIIVGVFPPPFPK